MKKLLCFTSIAAMLLPVAAFAAYNDVTITSTTLTLGEILVDITGDTATIESLSVAASSFTVTLQSGSVLEVTAPNRNKLEVNTKEGVTTDTCSNTVSKLRYAPLVQVVVTITPSGVPCSSSSGSTSSTSHSKGGSIKQAAAAAAVAVYAQTVSQGPAAPSAKVSLTANLSSGSRGAGVKSLQQFLNTHGFPIAASGSGSLGKESETFGPMTVQALQKFQKEYGIITSGTPETTGFGKLGPKTRAKIKELSGN